MEDGRVGDDAYGVFEADRVFRSHNTHTLSLSLALALLNLSSLEVRKIEP